MDCRRSSSSWMVHPGTQTNIRGGHQVWGILLIRRAGEWSRPTWAFCSEDALSPCSDPWDQGKCAAFRLICGWTQCLRPSLLAQTLSLWLGVPPFYQASWLRPSGVWDIDVVNERREARTCLWWCGIHLESCRFLQTDHGKPQLDHSSKQCVLRCLVDWVSLSSLHDGSPRIAGPVEVDT